jgi:hypothetical protein
MTRKAKISQGGTAPSESHTLTPAGSIPAPAPIDGERIARLEADLAAVLHLLRGGASMRIAYTPEQFAALIGKSKRWVREQVDIGEIARVRRLNAMMIPASEVERFRTGRAPLAS